MIPIELPLSTDAGDAMAAGRHGAGKQSAPAGMTLESGLFTSLKESFAAALADVAARQSDLAQQPKGLSQAEGELACAPGVQNQDLPELPEVLAALVALLKADNQTDAGALNPLLQADQTTSAQSGQECEALAVLDTAVAAQIGTTPEAFAVMDATVSQKGDRDLSCWLERMGVTNQKIQTRALEQWLKNQQMPPGEQPAPGRLASLVRANSLTQGSDLKAFIPQTRQMLAALWQQTADQSLTPATASEPVAEAGLTRALASEGEPAATRTTMFATVDGAVLPSATGAMPEIAQEAKTVPTKHSGVHAETLLAQLQAKPGKGSNTGDAGGSENPGKDLLDQSPPGMTKEQNFTPKVFAKAGIKPLAGQPETPTETRPDNQAMSGLRQVAEKENPMPSHPHVTAPSDTSVNTQAGDRSAVPDINPVLEAAALAKTDTSGSMHGPGMQTKEVQAFMRQHAPEVMTQIVDKAVVNVRNGHKEMKIALKPAFLGQMQMRIITANQQVSIRILTESAVVKEAIENHLYQLKADLGNHGLNIERVDVFMSSDAQQQSEYRQTATPQGGDQLNKEEQHANRERQRRSRENGETPGADGDQPDGIDYFV